MIKAWLSATAVAALLTAPLAAHAAQGLNGAFYTGVSTGSVAGAQAAIGSLTPAATFTAIEVCFPDCAGTSIGDGNKVSTLLGGNATDLSSDSLNDLSNHVIDLTGFFNVSVAGIFNFKLDTDDGSALFVDNVKVVDDDGAHGMQNAFGSAVLTAGAHSLEIIQFENGGVTGLDAFVSAGANNVDYVALGARGELSTSTGGGVPEPAAWALMLLGFGGMGAALRARRRSVSTTA